MNRRGFLSLLGGVLGGIALDQAIPFNRVWSFPTNIVIADPLIEPEMQLLTISQITREVLLVLKNNLVFKDYYDQAFYETAIVGNTVSIQAPKPYVTGWLKDEYDLDEDEDEEAA